MIISVPLPGKTSLSSSLAACRPRIITATTHSTTAACPAFIAALPLALYPLPPPPLAPHSLPPPLSSHMHCRHRRRPLLASIAAAALPAFVTTDAALPACIAAAAARPVFIATVADLSLYYCSPSPPLIIPATARSVSIASATFASHLLSPPPAPH